MKFIKSLFSILLLAVTCATVTSCGNDDPEEKTWGINKVTLGGSWVCENLGVFHETQFYNSPLSCSASKSFLQFNRPSAYSKSGTGKQIDSFPFGPYTEIFRTFKWFIDSKKDNLITITYDAPGYEPLYIYYPGWNETAISGYASEDKDSKETRMYYFTPAAFGGEQYSGKAYETSPRGNWEEQYEIWLDNQNQFNM